MLSSANIHSIKTQEGDMRPDFSISNARVPILGDYVAFKIHDKEATLPAKISRPALAVLGGGSLESDIRIFELHKEKIRVAAYQKYVAHPGSREVSLCSDDL
jgi:hypothetical protein